MANEQNLMPIQEVNSRRTREQHSKDSSKGGKASVEARRKKKTMRELASLMAAAPVKSITAKRSLEKMGLDEEDMTNDALVTQALFYKALEGDVKAIEKWEELTSTETDNTIEALHDLLDGIGTIE